MKILPTALAAATLTLALAAPLAQAADISQGVKTLELVDGSVNFGHAFAGGNAGNTFSDRYNFSARAGDAFAAVIATPNWDWLGLGAAGIDSFTVYNTAGFSLAGVRLSTDVDPYEVWSAGARDLATDGYYLVVKGTVRNNFGGGYSGALTLAPVPEPATYAMLLGGAGVLGWLGRRRKGAGTAPAPGAA